MYLRVNLLGPGPRLINKGIYRAAVSLRLKYTGIWLVVLCYRARLETFSGDCEGLFCCTIFQKSVNVYQTTWSHILGKGKAIPLHAWTGPERSMRLTLSDFKTVGT